MKNYYSESKAECSEIAASACTTILVGNQVTVDGSFIIARNEDHEAINAK